MFKIYKNMGAGTGVSIRTDDQPAPEDAILIGGGKDIEDATANALNVLAEQFPGADTEELLGMILDDPDDTSSHRRCRYCRGDETAYACDCI